MKQVEAYALIFSPAEIKYLIDNNKELEIKNIFKLILPKRHSLPKTNEIISLFKNNFFNDKKCFSYVFYPNSNELLYTTRVLFTKEQQIEYQKHAEWGYKFYFYKRFSRKEKLKDL